MAWFKGSSPGIRATALVNPDRIACFLLADWERMEVSTIEQVFNLLGTRFPEARMEAILLDSGTVGLLDLILVVG